MTRGMVLLWMVLSSGVAMAKGPPHQVTERRLTAAATIDGIALPARARVTEDATWDDQARGFGDAQLVNVRLARAATVCATRLPAHVDVSVRRGLPAFVWGEVDGRSTTLHLVWTAPRATRIAGQRIRAGETIGVECPDGRVTLRAAKVPFRVGDADADYASWYPSDLGGGLLAIAPHVAAKVDGVSIPTGFTATLARDGALVTIVGPPDRDVIVGDRVCSTGTLGTAIRFDGGGRISDDGCTPAR